MKYCSKCGNEIIDEAVICPKCGCETEYHKYATNKNKSLRLIAKIFMLISCIIMSFLYIFVFSSSLYFGLLACNISMTIYYWKQVKKNEPVGTAFKVCTLIFVSFIAGILMICDENK